MKIKVILSAFVLTAGAALSNCAVLPGGGSASQDVNSSNPAVAAQAQKVVGLENEVKQQKAIFDAEKTKLDGLEMQLKGARQNLKGLKTQAKAN